MPFLSSKGACFEPERENGMVIDVTILISLRLLITMSTLIQGDILKAIKAVRMSEIVAIISLIMGSI
jgi:hypothetical protein